MGRMKSLYIGIIIAVFLLGWGFCANQIVEQMIDPPDLLLFGIAPLFCFGASFLLKADYIAIITTFFLWVVYYSVISYFNLPGYHDAEFPGSVYDTAVGFITLFFPLMFAGFMTWKYLDKKKLNSPGKLKMQNRAK